MDFCNTSPARGREGRQRTFESACHRALAVLVVCSVTIATASFRAPDAAADAPINFIPHRAVYAVELARGNPTGGVADLTGRLVYELTGSRCDSFTQTMRFVTRTTNGEGQLALSDMRSSFEEAGNGKRFAFNSQNFRNKRLSERTEGVAEIVTPSDQQLKISLTRPRAASKTFSRDVMFPVSHSFALIKAARAGKKLLITDLYDGSDEGLKVFRTTAVIGAEMTQADLLASAPDTAQAIDALEGLAAWPVSLSYFEDETSAQDATPVYELAFVMFENGVSRTLYIDYGTFAIRGRLTRFEVLESDPCE